MAVSEGKTGQRREERQGKMNFRQSSPEESFILLLWGNSREYKLHVVLTEVKDTGVFRFSFDERSPDTFSGTCHFPFEEWAENREMSKI